MSFKELAVSASHLVRSLSGIRQAEHVIDGIKLTPSVAFVATALAGVHWDTVSYVTASAYSVLMFCLTVWSRIIKPWRANRAAAP